MFLLVLWWATVAFRAEFEMPSWTSRMAFQIETPNPSLGPGAPSAFSKSQVCCTMAWVVPPSSMFLFYISILCFSPDPSICLLELLLLLFRLYGAENSFVIVSKFRFLDLFLPSFPPLLWHHPSIRDPQLCLTSHSILWTVYLWSFKPFGPAIPSLWYSGQGSPLPHLMVTFFPFWRCCWALRMNGIGSLRCVLIVPGLVSPLSALEPAR